MSIEFRNLKPGDEITVVHAWTESETLDEISGHFLTTKIESIYFQPDSSNKFADLKIFAKDADGRISRVNWILQNGEIKETGVRVKILNLKNNVVEFPKPLALAKAA